MVIARFCDPRIVIDEYVAAVVKQAFAPMSRRNLRAIIRRSLRLTRP